MKIYANLKCNHSRKSFENYAEILDQDLKSSFNTHEIVVFPPSSAFSELKFSFRQGAQNFYPTLNGNFTGEIGLEMLEEFDIKDVIIGHSERRILGENDEFLKHKFDFAKEKGLNIIFCIGESDVVYMNGSSKEFLKSQLKELDLEYKNLTIAYEPIWAIGSGKSASPEYIDEILDFLRTLSSAPLLYGGSVNLGNIAEISSIKNCNGVLVGSASFEVENFIKLIREIE
ncbi:triose-phosphate isomerase [Campylobacter corcagiensis]|uniref:Triosephosphate isomerase n=1 Tax=Campylobacter corcagiensis TaxID=1448857 RepID=A0A7M1LGC0_9BACT|nr:triose-phosphate isomerase [Campylobacter corcagiensis]QKF64166.1 triosephosphate isomerase [Campylobacter corcagiensis]QOQ87639.1 triose-phosphate isomerase [Campylobacter corcagiensis]